MPTILTFGAHPDDCELGCGGVELLARKEGYDVQHVLVTSGDAGSHTITPGQLGKIREAEAEAAAKKIGASRVHFLGLRDGFTATSRDDKIRVIELIRSVRPNIIFVHSSHDTVSDHKLVHGLVTAAVGAAGGPWFQEAKGEPWATPAVYGYEVWHPIPAPQMVVDISNVIKEKLAALACYKSQLSSIKYDEAIGGLARYRGEMFGTGEFAEAFEVIRVGLHL